MRIHALPTICRLIVALLCSLLLYGNLAGAAVSGDVNDDGVVNLKDAIQSLGIITSKSPAVQSSITADGEGDGRVGLAESISTLQTALGQQPAFTFATSAGQFNTRPAGAASVRVTCQGQTRSGSASPLTFTVPLGSTTFTAEALNGSGATVATMGLIQLTADKSFPLTTPMAFTAFPTFDIFHTDIGLATLNTFIYFGTDNRDRVVQYGGTANDLLSVDMGEEEDWSDEYGGDGNDSIRVASGSNDGTSVFTWP